MTRKSPSTGQKRLPNFKSREEEVRFWQRTGLEELAESEWEEIEVERTPRGST